jgi:elongation factor P
MSEIVKSNDVKPGQFIEVDGSLYEVLDTLQNKTAMRKMVVEYKVRDVRTGTNKEITFGGGDKVTVAWLEKKKMNFSYNDGNFYVFMDPTTFESLNVSNDLIGDNKNYLADNCEVNIVVYNNEILRVEFPAKVALKVTHTEDAVRGDTINKPMKDATLETGYTVKVPMFIKVGDMVNVRTDTGEYDSRAN